MTVRYLPFLFTCLCLLSFGCSSVYVPPMPLMPSSAVVTETKLAYPIILLHGLGQKSHAWDGGAIHFYEQEMGLSFGGVLSMKDGRAQLSSSSQNTRDFFTVSFTNATDSISAWGRELEQYISLVREKTKAQKVILIGYSMGGLASRWYLTRHLQDHHVKRLITIGTPHLGSPFARIYKIKTALTSRLNDNPNFVSAAALKTALAAVTACESDVAFDAPALHDLMRPEDGGQFLDALGKAEHPGDIDYVSVVGDVDVVGEVQKLNSAAVQEVLRRSLEFFEVGVGALFSKGDGVVSAQSQTLNNVPWFKNNPQHQRLTRTVSLASVHTDHLKNSNEIQRVTLEDKPEFKGAEFFLVNNQPCLVVDFTDFLPLEKSKVTISYNAYSGERTVLCTNMRLIRSESGEVLCRAYIPITDVDYSKNFSTSISISNYFANKATATKMWIRP